MIQYSFSTVLMATLCCNLMVVFLFLIFHVKNVLPEFGLKLTGFFLILVAIRLLLPVEFPIISHNIIFPASISRAVALVRQPRFLNHTVSWWNLLEIVWAAGCIGIGLYRIFSNYRAFRLIKQISRDPDIRCLSIMQRIQEELFQGFSSDSLSQRKKRYLQNITVRILPASHSPMVCGLRKPYILLPGNLEFSDEELYFVLKHEIQHIIHRDLWLKLGMQSLVVLYWWNPFCWLLEDYLNRFLEMCIDFSMADNPKQKAAYLTCLLSIVKQLGNTNPKKFLLSINFSTSANSALRQRFELLMDTDRINRKEQRTCHQKIAMCGMSLLFLCSFLFIFEAYYISDNNQRNSISSGEENSFFIDNQDGTYDLYITGQYIETIDSLEYYDQTIPIYDSLKEALQDETK